MEKSQAELLALTPEQQKAFRRLKQAFAACAKSGLYLWDNYGDISAVNGGGIDCITTDSRGGELLDESNLARLRPKKWGSSNADDPLYVQRL